MSAQNDKLELVLRLGTVNEAECVQGEDDATCEAFELGASLKRNEAE